MELWRKEFTYHLEVPFLFGLDIRNLDDQSMATVETLFVDEVKDRLKERKIWRSVFSYPDRSYIYPAGLAERLTCKATIYLWTDLGITPRCQFRDINGIAFQFF